MIRSSKRNTCANPDRMADQRGSGIILVKSHPKARRHIGAPTVLPSLQAASGFCLSQPGCWDRGNWTCAAYVRSRE
jgi:hypothetical protein